MARDKRFRDVDEQHWAFRTLQALSAKHIINGVAADRFDPEGTTTRSEFTALLVRTLGLAKARTAAPFSDVLAGAWYAEDVAAAYEAGLIEGESVSLRSG
ncbi:S-layer homology domain-containing protein [Paenibacillus alginolyticus]|uniref:S-layer homology domain-containing protein n=1 Tax=Paenibacillus alginolyticus TaxID=59839 RepID=UPI0006881B95|nr:S-layer homology domain-containing protein [Paenibacillus alginolyticus]MCY9665670.1 S-layer homology domain-containing protein [Paenibacillus alginolyticus]